MYLPEGLSRLFYRADDVLRRRGVWSTYGFLRQTQWWSEEKLDELQRAKLRSLTEHAGEHSPYYREVFAKAGIAPADIRSVEDLASLPILTREIIRERGPELRSRGVPEREALPNSTGGSTGSNVKFWVDRACWRWRDAIDLRVWEIMGLRPGVSSVSIWGAPMDLDAATKARTRLRYVLDNRRLVSAYRVGDAELASLAKLLAATRPKVIFGYSSVLDRLATVITRDAIPWPSDPGRVVVSCAEQLYPEQRRNIGTALRARVLDNYGCRELGTVAVQCAVGEGLHVMEERFLVETLPSDDRRASRLLVTDLDNRAFPFLRYEIGDLVEPGSTGCACGRRHRKFASLQGRSFDVIVGPTGRAVGGTFWSLLLRTAVRGIDTWQVVQAAPDVVEMRITPRAVLSENDRAKIRAEVRQALGDGMQVEFAEYDYLEPLPSGKHRFVVGLPGARR